jgi:hypothetical protein
LAEGEQSFDPRRQLEAPGGRQGELSLVSPSRQPLSQLLDDRRHQAEVSRYFSDIPPAP